MMLSSMFIFFNFDEIKKKFDCNNKIHLYISVKYISLIIKNDGLFAGNKILFHRIQRYISVK